MSDSDFERRAAERRARMTLRWTTLDSNDPDPVVVTGTAAMEAAYEMTEQAWLLAGRTLPAYRRSEIPVRLLRDSE